MVVVLVLVDSRRPIVGERVIKNAIVADGDKKGKKISGRETRGSGGGGGSGSGVAAA